MLRITLPTADRSGLFILEGRLTGLWAKELARVARASNQGYDNTFDLQDVFYVDSAGEQALRWLGGRGAKFIVESAYGKDLCNRLKLERVTSAGEDIHNGKKRGFSSKPRLRQTADAGELDQCAAAGANQHLSVFLQ